MKDAGTTAHENNYHKAYNNPICQFGEAILADIRYLANYKLRQRNLDQKIKGKKLREDRRTRKQLRQDGATTLACPRMCDYDYYSLEEEERQTM